MSRKRILFIDSDDGFVRNVATSLQRSGFDALLASSSTDGVERARQDRPDLIVVNVELAPTNGWSVCTKLKKDDDLKGIPIVLTSSTSTQDTFEKHKKLKTRADEYLLKPYETNDLIRVAGGLVGLPETPADQEDLIVEDESLSAGDFDLAGIDEEIPVHEDEPFGDQSAAGEHSAAPHEAAASSQELDPLVAPSHELDPFVAPTHAEEDVSVDPLAASPTEATLATDNFDDLNAELGLSSTPPPLPSDEAAVDDLSAFDESFANLAPASAAQPAESAAFGELGDDHLSHLNGEAPADPLAVDPLASDSLAEAGFSVDDLSFDEAPLEVPSEAAPTGEAGGSAADDLPSFEETSFPADGFEVAAEALTAEPSSSGLGSFDDSARVAGLETRVAELEAELEGYRTTENTRDQELEHLRLELAQRDREADDLRTQALQRDKTIRELKESESRANLELTKAKDERTRREATLKALTQKAEQVSTNALRLERELNTAREDAKSAPALRTRIAELEKAQKEALSQASSLREQLEAAQQAHEALKADHAEATSGQEAARADAEAARHDAETARAEASEAKAQAEEQRQQAEQAKQDAEHARQDAAQAKTEAEQAKSEAEQAKSEAEQAKSEAAQAQQQAEQAKQEAVQAKQAAEEAARAADESRREAEELRKQNEELQQSARDAQSEMSNLREQLSAAEERIKALSAQAQTATERAARAREALRQAAEHLTHEPS